MSRIERIRRAVKAAVGNLRGLDLHNLRERIRSAKAQRARRKKALDAIIRRRDDLRERLERFLDEGGHPAPELRELEAKITVLDKHAEMAHTIISRRTQLLRRLKPKNRARTKQRQDLNERIRSRRKKLRRAVRDHRHEDVPTQGVVTFDGKPCAGWIARDLQTIRTLGWGGYLLSGFRTPAYSASLCWAMCDAPTCPGRCAGASSEHSQYVEPRGAADLDPAHLSQALALLRQIGSPLHNAIGPSDPNHVSASGH